jgi:hypothetical protein
MASRVVLPSILLASNVGNSVPQIAGMWMTDESHVRRIITTSRSAAMQAFPAGLAAANASGIAVGAGVVIPPPRTRLPARRRSARAF